jgi:uncharacterized protein DUF955
MATFVCVRGLPSHRARRIRAFRAEPADFCERCGDRRGRPGRNRGSYTDRLPLLRCTNDECKHTAFHRSSLAGEFDCEWCGSPMVVDSGYGDQSDEPVRVPGRRLREEGAHLANAREGARTLLVEHRANALPVPVRGIARLEGLTIEDDVELGPTLRARLVNKAIQVRPGGAPLKRFSIAHELGHWIFGTRHGDGQKAEGEANAFAGELLGVRG